MNGVQTGTVRIAREHAWWGRCVSLAVGDAISARTERSGGLMCAQHAGRHARWIVPANAVGVVMPLSGKLTYSGEVVTIPYLAGEEKFIVVHPLGLRQAPRSRTTGYALEDPQTA